MAAATAAPANRQATDPHAATSDLPADGVAPGQGSATAEARGARSPRFAPDKHSGLGRGYIHGLDGLRALAIIAVLVFHLRPSSLVGGYLGVDVFFVISGFLITTLLIRELRRKGRVNLKSFWLRRARRLLPALITVVIATVSLALIAGNDLLVHITRQVVGALTFSNNWVEISAGSSYFNATSPQLFVNFWSLAVEEQFYLIWPWAFVLIVALGRTGRARVGTVIALAAASALTMALLYSPGADATRVYYGTDAHAFGLMIGAALALSAASESANIFATWWYRRPRVLIGIAGLVGLIALMANLAPDTAFAYRGGILAASLCTAAIIGAFPGRVNAVQALFDLPALVWLGRRSYGIYMWHWPVILLVGAFAPAAAPDSGAAWIQRLCAVVLAIAVAAASYRWIEEPVRKLGFKETARRVRAAVSGAKWLSPARISALATTVVVAMFAVALAVAPDQSQVQMAMSQASGLVNTGAAPVADNGDGAKSVKAGAQDEETKGQETKDQDASAKDSDSSAGKADAASDAAKTEKDADAESATKEAFDPDAELRTKDGLPLGDEISGFGDSMMYVAAPALTKDFPGIDLDAVSNRQWPAIADAVTKALDTGTVRKVVVISAGTNAGVRDEEIVRKTLDALGPDRLVVLVNIYGASYWVPESNQNLADIAADYPNVAVADWHAAASKHPDQLQPDATHPDMKGMYLYADVISAALKTLV